MDEEQARAAAQARRQRILEGADKRMDRVNGISADGEEEVAPESSGSSTKSKLAAMRRRRFKKSSAAASAATNEGETTTTETVKEAPALTTKEVTPPKVVEEIKDAVVEEVISPTEDAPPSESTAGTTDEGDGTTKKKYLGVARMRRNMIKKKQQEKLEAEQGGDLAPKASIPKKFSKVAGGAGKSLIPILMHLVTILLLFGAGLEVALQQNVIEYRGDLTVHQTLAPQQELKLWKMVSAAPSPSGSVVKDPLLEEGASTTAYVPIEEDEFAEADGGPRHVNLDPLFGVDFDVVMAGPGLLKILGRMAIVVHRLNLSVFYYFPLRMWANLLGLLSSPPVLCLAALAIRQGSNMLGGKLPKSTADDAKTSSSQPQDVVTMAKNFVGGFIGKAFPTAIKFYDAWTHLRSDMYVVLCGLFVGLVWHHYLSGAVGITDEVWTEDVPEVLTESLANSVGSEEL
jgi:hypothetical protein